MPAELILVIMALVALSIGYLNVWGDPSEDPLRAGQIGPVLTGKLMTARFTAEADRFRDLGAQLTGLPRPAERRLPKGPTLTLRPLPVPAPDAVPGWDWHTLALATEAAPEPRSPAEVIERGRHYTAQLDGFSAMIPVTCLSVTDMPCAV